ncbi:restriction endonuclease subunit S [Escherichia albertii]|uniref:restriction endonuclease subunit S n=1 Tax=Escherichia albertii TaxID=208962 RepID=UPI0022B6876A|nr:restriction endonuclease subunit S [Escherichia albertii]MCZ7517360.1 restriction endonuclease subunit S [Escherichia albertii]
MSWPMVKLESISEFIRNGASIKQDKAASGLPITRIETIAERKVNLEKCGYADIKDNEYKDYRLLAGDILISHINSEKHLGKCAIFEEDRTDVIHGMNLLCLRPIKEKISPRYLFHFLSSFAFLNLISSITKKSVNQASFTVTAFKLLEIPLPPLAEQKRIAAILDKADSIRQKREQAIKLADDFLRATFLEMFGDPVENPKGWNVKPLADQIVHANNGISRRRKEDTNEGDIVLRLQDVHYSGIAFDKELNRIKLVDKEKQIARVEYDDLLFIRVNGNPNYVGRTAVFKSYIEPVYHNDHLIRIKLDNEYQSDFLCYLINSPFSRKLIAQQIKTSAGQHTISQDGILKLMFYRPPIELQEKFINIKNKIESIFYRKDKHEDLFASISNKLIHSIK